MRKIILLVFALCTLKASAEIKLPALVGDHMLLQQQAKVSFWGSASPNSMVTVITSWDKKSYQTKSEKTGKWKVNVQTPAAGGPFEIKISDGSAITLHDVLVGDVWICSGQSNMEMAMRGNSSPILNANEIILNADNDNIRLFKVKTASSLSPLADVEGDWKRCTPASARDFSAIGYQFADVLQKKLHVPVGMIMSTVGGTMIEAWMRQESLLPFSQVKIPATLENNKKPHREPTALFNGMIAPLRNYAFKGIIWMQGESNRQEPELYGKLFPAMVKDWRKQFNQGEFPFYYAQIAPYGSTDTTRSGAKLREAQLNAMSEIPNSGMACLLDVGMESDIHFMNKTIPAHRLAYWALAKTYNIAGIGYQGPMYKSMKINGNEAVLSFESAPYLTSYRKPLTLFEVAGEDHIFHPATAEINRNTVTVKSEKVLKPVAVRYAFKEFVVGELYNNDGLPASSFRTDNWK
ncbi:MAG: sialate O-acetylesterase [Pedobacter sp.]|nr:sialate O-acetylesterase [Pedobacter sp.]